MVDVGEKDVTRREAVARGTVLMQPATLQLIMAGACQRAMFWRWRVSPGSWPPSARPT